MSRIEEALRRSRVVALLGPRQSGKTTLAREVVPAGSPNYFDLENPNSLAQLADPMLALEGRSGIVVIDEVQRRPELFPALRVLVDRVPLPAKFLVLGSASPHLLRQASESLAGRIQRVEIGGFGLGECGAEGLGDRWNRGGMPLAYLAGSDDDSLAWRTEYIRTVIEHDVPALGHAVSVTALTRFWAMVAHYHGGIWSSADPARSLGVSEPTVRKYLDLLTDVFLVRQLQPWFENLGKRQVRSPKVYVRDTGLLHALLGLRTYEDLLNHPKCGASWEGFAIEEVLRATDADEAFFWATHQGAELDLLLFKHGRRFGVEVKREDAPRITKSMRIAMEDLKLEKLTIVYPGAVPYDLAENVRVIPLPSILDPAVAGAMVGE